MQYLNELHTYPLWVILVTCFIIAFTACFFGYLIADIRRILKCNKEFNAIRDTYDKAIRFQITDRDAQAAYYQARILQLRAVLNTVRAYLRGNELEHVIIKPIEVNLSLGKMIDATLAEMPYTKGN